MKTYPVFENRAGDKVAFEIESAYVGMSTVAGILMTVPGVTDVQVRRRFGGWLDDCQGVHGRFRYQGVEGVVWEPFGDSSRYWIGQKDSTEPVDFSDLEQAFVAYQPSLCRRFLGDLLTLSWFRRKRGGPPTSRPGGSRARTAGYGT